MAFNLPAQTSIAKLRPTTTPSAWTRPADWISITDTAGEVQFLVSDVNPVYGIKTTFNKPAGQNLYIDWGDGTTTTVSTNTLVSSSHTYTTGGTPCSRGYNTWKIRIYVDAGAQITGAYFYSTTDPNPGFACTVLEAYYGDGTINNAYQYFYSSQSLAGELSFGMLEYCKLPATMTGTTNTLYATFYACYQLAKVVMPTSMPNTTTGLYRTFWLCYSLLEVDIPTDATGVTQFAQVFYSCSNLIRIGLPSTWSSCSPSRSTDRAPPCCPRRCRPAAGLCRRRR